MSTANLMCLTEHGRLPLKIASDFKEANFAKPCESTPLEDLTSLANAVRLSTISTKLTYCFAFSFCH